MSSGTPESQSIGRWVASAAVLCVVTLWLQFHHLSATMPYPQHVDEGFVAGPAHRTMVTGTLHPYTFNYPSLPKYLAAVGMAAGFLRGAARQEVAEVQRVGNVGFPYYDTPRVMQTARQLFALLAAAAVAAAAAASFSVTRRPASILLTPLLLISSPLFFYHSWAYLNVDIIATCFTTLALLSVLRGTYAPTMTRLALVPGLFAGLATGSKYTLAVVLAPVLVAICLYMPRGRRIAAAMTATAAMVVAFLAAVPYSVIDVPGFLNGLASEAFHYSSGHRGFQDQPGWPQLLFYARHFANEFGLGAIFAIVGLFALVARDWRRAAVLSSFPLALLWLLAGQRVHFTRNVLALHPVVAIYAAAGVLWVFEGFRQIAVRRGWFAQRRQSALTAAAVCLALAAVPWSHVIDHLRDRTDSRNAVKDWVPRQLPPDWGLVVPTELGFDARDLGPTRRVASVSLQSARDGAALRAALAGVQRPAVVLLPHWGADERFAGGEIVEPLNAAASGWKVMERFGSRDVLVNYSNPTPQGDPAFSVVVVP